MTPYYVMKIGSLPVVPYHPPGDIALAEAVADLARKHHEVLLANHDPVVSAQSLEEAVLCKRGTGRGCKGLPNYKN